MSQSFTILRLTESSVIPVFRIQQYLFYFTSNNSAKSKVRIKVHTTLCLKSSDIWLTVSLLVDSKQFYFVLCVILKITNLEVSFLYIFSLNYFCGYCNGLFPPFQTVFNAAINAVGLSFWPGNNDILFIFYFYICDGWFPWKTCLKWCQLLFFSFYWQLVFQ